MFTCIYSGVRQIINLQHLKFYITSSLFNLISNATPTGKCICVEIYSKT